MGKRKPLHSYNITFPSLHFMHESDNAHNWSKHSVLNSRKKNIQKLWEYYTVECLAKRYSVMFSAFHSFISGIPKRQVHNVRRKTKVRSRKSEDESTAISELAEVEHWNSRPSEFCNTMSKRLSHGFPDDSNIKAIRYTCE